MKPGFKCGNCGHVHEESEEMRGLFFYWLGPRASISGCRNCGSCTIQQAYDDTFTKGIFIIVRTKNRIRGKG